MNYVHLSIGTNLFDRIRNIRDCLKKISEFSKILEISSIYESEPYGYEFQNSFLNLNVLIITSLSPFELLSQLKKIENLFSRKKFFKNAPRIIDIDILIFNEYKINSENLKIPHYELYKRKFFIIPLIEIFSKGYRSLNFDYRKIDFKDGWISLYLDRKKNKSFKL